jgi:hypothetical protein
LLLQENSRESLPNLFYTLGPAMAGVLAIPEMPSRHLCYHPGAKYLMYFLMTLISLRTTLFVASTLNVQLFWQNCIFQLFLCFLLLILTATLA